MLAADGKMLAGGPSTVLPVLSGFSPSVNVVTSIARAALPIGSSTA
jgi:hypothetical protein